MGLTPEEISSYRTAMARRSANRRAVREAARQRAGEMVAAALRRLLPAYPAVERAYLFGSVTRPGTFTSRSDVDVALEGISTALAFEIWRSLEAVAKDWPLDVRVLDGSPVSERIRSKGWLVYGRADPGAEVRHPG